MKKVVIISASIWLMTLVACDSENPQLTQQKALEKEVMAIHDSIMPRMGAIQALKSKTKQLVDSLQKDSTEQAKVAILQTRLNDLEIGKKAMWDWMHAYKAPDSTLFDKKSMTYLEEQKKEITTVKEKMLYGIEQTQKTLDSLNKAP